MTKLDHTGKGNKIPVSCTKKRFCFEQQISGLLNIITSSLPYCSHLYILYSVKTSEETKPVFLSGQEISSAWRPLPRNKHYKGWEDNATFALYFV